MTITQLKYTLAVAEYGNFTTASEKCFVTQPTLSMQVQKLEEELGVLFLTDPQSLFRLLKLVIKFLFKQEK